MSTRAALPWSLFILVAVASLLLWQYDRALKIKAQHEVGSLRQAQQQIEKDRRSIALVGQGIPSSTERENAVASSPVPSNKPVRPPSATQALRANASLQAYYLAAKKASVAAAYGPFFRERNLSGSAAQRLSELIRRREESVFDAAAAVPRVFTAMTEFDNSDQAHLVIDPYDPATFLAGRLPPAEMKPNADTLAVGTLLRQGVEWFNAEATQLLGKEGFDALESYERTLDLQPTVREFAGQINVAGQPLTPSQSDQIARALADATTRYRTGGEANPLSIDWDQATANLGAVLTSDQIAAIQYSLRYKSESQHYNQKLDEFRREQEEIK